MPPGSCHRRSRLPGGGPSAYERSEIPAAEVPAAEVASPEVAATGIAVTGIAAAEEGMGGQRLPEQEPGEQAGSETEAAPVGGGEAGVDVVHPAAVGLHLAHLGLDAPLKLVRAGGADRDLAARPAARRRPVGVG